MRTRNDWNNALIQRVRRHSRVSVLFKRASFHNQLPSVQSPQGVQEELPVTRSFIPKIQPADDSRPLHAPFRIPMAIPAAPPSSQPVASEADDRDWQRLETIWRKHQEARTEGTAPPGTGSAGDAAPEMETGGLQSEQPASVFSPRSGATHPEEPVFKGNRDHSAPITTVLDHQMPEKRSEPESAPGAPTREENLPQDQASIPGERGKLDLKSEVTGGEKSSPAPSSLPTSIQRPSVKRLSIESPSIQRQADWEGKGERRQLSSAEHPPDEAARPVGPGRLDLHKVPLQEAWPVQSQVASPRLHPEKKAVQERSGPEKDPDLNEAEVAQHLLQPEDEPVQRDVSAVEVLSPRGPRPKQGSPDLSTRAPSEIIRADSQPDEKLGAGLLGEAHIPTDRSEQAGETNQAGETPPERADQEVVQRSQASEFIETEVGPLPADLWRLIGQEPAGLEDKIETQQGKVDQGPEPTESQALAGESQSTGQSSRKQPPAADANQVDEPDLKENQDAPGLDRSRQVQRLSQESFSAAAQPMNTAEAGTLPPISPSNTSLGEESSPSTIDLDDLVNQVYQEIRRRISREWERFRP